MSVSPWLVVAAAPFGEACDGHVLIVAIGASDGGAARSALVPTVKALASLLAKRARVALGCPDKPIRWISPREQQVLELLIEGMSVKEIGETLGRSPHTITDHLKSLHRKLEANSRGELVSKALGRHSSRGGAAKTQAHEGSMQNNWQ
jgi:DNA-binding CsgD family transcriptional regulator